MTAIPDTSTASVFIAPPTRSRVRRWLADTRTIIGLGFLAVVLLIVAFGPLLAPHSITEFLAPPFSPPSAEFLLGTDYMGQDVLSRTLNGGWTVVWMSATSATLGVAVGAVLGMLAGYSRGFLDEVIMRLSDVALALPTMVLTLLFVAMLGRSLPLIVLLIGLAHAPSVARVVRGVTVDVAGREFVESAQAIGAGRLRILLRQILPNVTGPIMVEYGLRTVWSVVAIASLSVIGQGVAPPQADWGLMVNENRVGITVQPWGVIAPLLLIAMFAVAMNLLAEGVDRALQVGREGGNQ